VGHVASRLEWRHRIEKLPARPKDSDSHRPAHLVSGKRQKIAIEILHIDREMRDGLCGIDKHERSAPMRVFTNFPGGVDPTEDVRNVGKVTSLVRLERSASS
jgi:hypothetical protein